MSELGRIIGQQVADWIAVNQKAIERRALLVGQLVRWNGRYKSNQVYAFNDLVMFRSYIALAMEDSPRGLPQPGGAGWVVVANLAMGGVDNFPDPATESELTLNTPTEVVTVALSKWAMKQIQDSVPRWPGLVRWRGWWSSSESYRDRDLVLYNRSVWLNVGGEGPPSRNGWEWLLSTQSGNAANLDEASAVLALHMLVPDSGGIMRGVVVGMGPLAADRGSGIYAKDEETGYYNLFGPNKPVWEGGRYIDEDNVSARDGGGTPYSKMPRLQDNPLATNYCRHSRNFKFGWSTFGLPTVSYDQIGFTGDANTASLVTDNDAGNHEYVHRTETITPGETVTVRLAVTKDSDETRFPGLRIGFSDGPPWGGTHARAAVHLNTKTGEIALALDASGIANLEYEVVDDGRRWIVLFSADEGSSTSDRFNISIYPAAGTVLGSFNPSATGSIIVENCELYRSKSIADVRGLPFIPTSGATVSIQETSYNADGANHLQTDYGYSFYWTPSYDTVEVTDKRELLSLADGPNLSYYDGDAGQAESTDGVNTVVGVQSVAPGTTYQINIAIGEAGANQLAIAVDNAPWQEGPYDGAFDMGTLLQLFRNHGYVGHMHDLQGWSGDYSAVKKQLDVLRGA